MASIEQVRESFGQLGQSELIITEKDGVYTAATFHEPRKSGKCRLYIAHYSGLQDGRAVGALSLGVHISSLALSAYEGGECKTFHCKAYALTDSDQIMIKESARQPRPRFGKQAHAVLSALHNGAQSMARSRSRTDFYLYKDEDRAELIRRYAAHQIAGLALKDVGSIEEL